MGSNCTKQNKDKKHQTGDPLKVASGSKMSNRKPAKERASFTSVNSALAICRNPQTGKYLAVNETKNRGWWIPGGGVDGGETFREGAHRECMEEAGVEIELKGVIKV